MNGIEGVFVDRTLVGWGLFAGRPFVKDELVFVFTGELLDLKSTLALGQWSFYSVQIGLDRYIDVEPPGAFINHSCAPNCGIRDSVRLVAVEDIASGTELLMDYSTCIADDPETMTCRCGAPECRGSIGDFFTLPLAVKQRYLALNIVSDFIAADRRSLISR